MGRKKIETIINEKISPYSLNESGKARLTQLVREYPYELLVECIDISVAKYFRYDKSGELLQDSVQTFFDKLGGIAHNKSLSPIDQAIIHLRNKGKSSFSYWNAQQAEALLHEYVSELTHAGWTDAMIIRDIQEEASRMMDSSPHWLAWSSTMKQWIDDIRHWNDEDTISIEQEGTILPDALFDDLQSNIKSLCKQINASYEHNLFDCTSVIMRRLLEALLVLSFQKAGAENDILDKSGKHHVSLDQMIKITEQNPVLALSANTKKDMSLFKDLGNYSAHKIWYNCTQGDIKPHILKYRTIIEELLYKSGIKQ